jgi:rubrerythrin
VCELYNNYGKFYFLESVRDEQKAIEFYERVLEKTAVFTSEDDMNAIEHIIQDESEHKRLFSQMYEKMNNFCTGLE